MRIALHSELRHGRVDDYLAHHVRIPVELVHAFELAGISHWTIWRSGHRLFHLVECGDWDHALRTLEDDPANLAWQAKIGEYVELFRDSDGDAAMSPLEKVWDLRDQISL
ncbi:L-rhamnose mutarotase [Microbacterium resistens]|uniref:L-rhamnose mutarotase n=1 Tax=Microbacterium resistens TaxID=156977 RepID=UPI003671C319